MLKPGISLKWDWTTICDQRPHNLQYEKRFKILPSPREQDRGPSRSFWQDNRALRIKRSETRLWIPQLRNGRNRAKRQFEKNFWLSHLEALLGRHRLIINHRLGLVRTYCVLLEFTYFLLKFLSVSTRCTDCSNLVWDLNSEVSLFRARLPKAESIIFIPSLSTAFIEFRLQSLSLGVKALIWRQSRSWKHEWQCFAVIVRESLALVADFLSRNRVRAATSLFRLLLEVKILLCSAFFFFSFSCLAQFSVRYRLWSPRHWCWWSIGPLWASLPPSRTNLKLSVFCHLGMVCLSLSNTSDCHSVIRPSPPFSNCRSTRARNETHFPKAAQQLESL